MLAVVMVESWAVVTVASLAEMKAAASATKLAALMVELSALNLVENLDAC